MFQMAQVKDLLKKIVGIVEDQNKKIDKVLEEHQLIVEVIRDSPDDKRQAMLDRMSKARAARVKKS